MTQSTIRNQALHDAAQAHRGSLTAMIRGMVRDQIEAEDVLQDVFEEYIAAYDIGLTIETVGAWLASVARNKVIDKFRRKKTKAAYEQTLRLQDAGYTNADDEVTSSLLREALVEALELLPPEQCEVFVMYELEGKTFKEIAALTKVPLGTLLARKKYAVDFLRKHLKEIYDDLD